MADSNVTKRALATAMKQLMAKEPFSKISVGDICQVCQMNRKSFYYHFRDKFELLNWIFDTECIAFTNFESNERRVTIMLDFCRYLYQNQTFYRNALQVRGQNSFIEHFQELTYIILVSRFKSQFEGQALPQRYINFAADGFVLAVVRWITEKDPISPEQFTRELFSYIVITSEHVCENLKNLSDWESML